MQKLLVLLVFTQALVSPALAEQGLYMGKAANGQPVYYKSAAAQCGDLPNNDPCWRNPAVLYTIGSDEVFAVTDCQRQVFKEVWIGDRKVATNVVPQSEALRLVLRTACNSVR